MQIGIDPGVTTGIAIADDDGRLVQVTSCGIIAAMDIVRIYAPDVLVIFEDARLRTWFGAKGTEALQGAGSVKRDASIWEEFLQSMQVPYQAIKPQKGSTKWPADRFKALTGWSGRTNEHARDAAMLVHKRARRKS